MNLNLDIEDLSLDNIADWPTPVKLGAIVVLSVALFGLGYWLLIKPAFEEYDTLKRRESTLKADFERKQHQASNLQAYRNQMVIMQERFGNMLKKLPTKNEMPGLLDDLSTVGIASGLTFELFAPQAEIEHDFYIELPIKIVVVGTYHQLAVFLSRVSDMDRIVTIHNFVVKNRSSKAEESERGEQLMMEITAAIYRYKAE